MVTSRPILQPVIMWTPAWMVVPEATCASSPIVAAGPMLTSWSMTAVGLIVADG